MTAIVEFDPLGAESSTPPWDRRPLCFRASTPCTRTST